MPRKRVYTESEFSAVLKRAAELQRTEGSSDAPGLSLEELEQIAEDAGIGPDYVKRAAFELDRSEPDKSDHLLGGPTRLDLEWIVDGEMSDTKWEEALGEIRRAFAAEGETRQEGRTQDWIYRDQMGGRVHVSMSPAGRQTRIRISYGMTEWLWLYVVALSLGIAPVAVQYALLNLGALLETGIALFIMMAFYMVGWLAFRFFTRKQDRKAQRLIARLDSLLADPEATARELADRKMEALQQADQAAPPEADHIDTSLLSEESPSQRASPAPRREREGG